MNINHMKAFLEVAKSGGFQLAADRLHVTQSTVSARIKVLETQLGRPLFVRKREGTELTVAGRHFHRFAHAAVRAWEQARQEVALPEALNAVVTLGVQMNHWERIAPAWVEQMQATAPHVGTRVVADYSENLLADLSDGLIDLAMTYIPRQQPGLSCELLMEDTLVLASTTPRKVSKQWQPDYVFVDWGAEFRAAHNLAYPETRAPRLSVGLSMIGLDYVLKHGGSGYFSERTIEPLLKEGRLHLIEKAPTFQRPVYLLHPKEPLDLELLTLAKGILKEVAAQDMDKSGRQG
ncbi:LysR family transcriptional regulator [Pseudomonas zhanjiangensis]|uniref:LysR family transcriptional regulator n=1 Tax=Pseudomonas zhanjiangensis TaxID=3239015 RepID=A0ABV3YW45_9PSED